MSEESDLLSQIERSKKLFEELKREMDKSASSATVTDETRNLTEEIFIKLRVCLDKTMYYRLCKNNFSGDLSKIYFPICKNSSDFSSLLKTYGLENLSSTDPDFIKLISDFQPFSQAGNKSLEILHEKGSKEKHKFLLREVKESNHVKTTFKSPGGEVSWTVQGVHFGSGVFINGVPINPATQQPAFIPPTHQLIKNYQVAIKLSDKDIEILSLCGSLINSVEKIVKETINLK